ncbi:MAG: class I mannose-6-phosphate isomerase [Pseudomonadota bacterium]
MNPTQVRPCAEAQRQGFARKLPLRFVEKVWGRDHLPTPFSPPHGKRIGEIWFEPPPELEQLLVKYMFTSEKLSVQVHPGESNAQVGEVGKDEWWLVVDADPGATLAIGFKESITAAAMAEAARSGEIEDLLAWHRAKVGDIFFLPAGTVHAIGPGLSLVEVQQNSDTTFRLYDYGRPRELHLDRAIAVARGERYDERQNGRIAECGQTLIDTSQFRIDRVEGVPDEETHADFQGVLLALPLEGLIGLDGITAGEEAKSVDAGAGECVLASSLDVLDFTKAKVTLLIAAK